ncbi:related to monocarboxylate transporter 4 [Rhynchosporium graminicola]|uniref:Related to monocarboxylate transporter 4 n=1 Tax=Rhynchosporium graminicola TaxID=2792576 RepID=A0A1E1KT16_9HELO|nr:related to monocarboxylate transporter 4 [Rhynchosporium commune]
MDEFFNFEDAARLDIDLNLDSEPNFTDAESLDFDQLMAPGPYDIDLAFVNQTDDENHFTCLQNFSSQEPQPPLSFNDHSLPETAMQDTTMMAPADFMDFPRWIDGMDVPARPCSYCQRMRLHCKVIKEGYRKGSCTSCVALDHSCSLTQPDLTINNNRGCHFCVPKTVNDNEDTAPDPCEHCFQQGSECKVIREGPNIGSCESCISFARECKAQEKGFPDAWGLEDLLDLNVNQQIYTPQCQGLCQGSLAHGRSDSMRNPVAPNSSDENIKEKSAEVAPKVGARFSRESIRILRGWLSTHHSHPYPTEEEKDGLRRQTGLNKTQITNWLANARRRGKVCPPRSTSPSVQNYPNGMGIPRRSTPALENMNPLERWKNSPPENEPASVTAIAKAVTSSTYFSGLASPSLSYDQTDNGSSRSLCNVSSTSSLGTSHSSGASFASAFSYKSRGSYGSFGSFGTRGRRRRRRQATKPVAVKIASGPPRVFQCTFCTETFKTKHDWQRHEKTLHLSLERWVCSPDGPAQYCSDDGHTRCVYCGIPNFSSEHAEMHNQSDCAEKSLEERTFYRKDHLRQHLSLVHDVKFQSFSMETWKVATPEIRSRCGFCGIVMDSWTTRVDHLAEHFKGGKSMADWKGDWGFEPQVLDIIENGMPPYLIHDERNSMNPFEASKEVASDEKTLEDKIKIGLVEYVHDAVMKGAAPTDVDLLIEARSIVRTADNIAFGKSHPEGSWFCDLILLSGTTEEKASGRPGSPNNSCIKGVELVNVRVASDFAPSALSTCIKQRALMSFVERRQALGLTPTDSELQAECCRILEEHEHQSSYKCQPALVWFKYLVMASSCWLRGFRERSGLPRSSEILSEEVRSLDDKSIDYSIHNHLRLVHELKDWVRFQTSLGNFPSDFELQNQARMIVFKNDDAWNQTAMDDPSMFQQFKQQAGLITIDSARPNMPEVSETTESSQASPKTLHWDLKNTHMHPRLESVRTKNTHPILEASFPRQIMNQPSTNTNPTQPLKYFLNDANCYGRLVRELTRFVTTCISANNPNQHLPSDAEIQNQARWVIYDDDDPWNQTAADNAEWLIRFKRDVGLSSPSLGPGLPLTHPSWRIADGGTGFSPPFISPQVPPPAEKFPENVDVPVTIDHKTYNSESEGGIGDGRTAADDVELLRKFKAMHGLSSSSIGYLGHQVPGMGMIGSDEELLAEFDHELTGMDFSTMDFTISRPASGTASALNSGSTLSSGGASPDFFIHHPQPQSHRHSDHQARPPVSDHIQKQPLAQSRSKGAGPAPDYAELYHVHAATASPLRRRSSTRMAARSGFALGVSPPRTTTALCASSVGVGGLGEGEVGELVEIGEMEMGMESGIGGSGGTESIGAANAGIGVMNGFSREREVGIKIEKEEPKLQNRRLFVCCDGTWIVGDVEGQQLTNVSKVARCIDYVDTWQPKKPMKGDMHREGDIMNKKDETPNNQAIELIDASETDDQPTTEDAAKTNDGTEAEKGVDKIPSPRNFVQIVHYQLGIGTGTGRIANNLDAMTGTGLSKGIRAAYSFISWNCSGSKDEIIFDWVLSKCIHRAVCCPIHRRSWTIDQERTTPLPQALQTMETPRTWRPSAGNPQIEICAVWDTVRAVLRRKYRTVCEIMPQNIELGIQALALGEKFDLYKPMECDEGQRDSEKLLRQRWFAGNHRDIGGGNKDMTLANITLAWVIGPLTDKVEFDHCSFWAITTTRSWSKPSPTEYDREIFSDTCRVIATSPISLRLLAPREEENDSKIPRTSLEVAKSKPSARDVFEGQILEKWAKHITCAHVNLKQGQPEASPQRGRRHSA